MSKRASNANKRKVVQPVSRSVKAKMQLLGFVRGKDAFLALMAEIKEVDQALDASYRMMRECMAGSPEEEDCLQSIRALEDKRFQLLSQVHGNRVQDYHLLTAMLE